MITIFNRRELTVTYDIQRQAKVRDLLGQYNIPYLIKVRDSSSFSRGRIGGFGDLSFAYGYKFYVKKSDYEQALAIINGKIK